MFGNTLLGDIDSFPFFENARVVIRDNFITMLDDDRLKLSKGEKTHLKSVRFRT